MLKLFLNLNYKVLTNIRKDVQKYPVFLFEKINNFSQIARNKKATKRISANLVKTFQELFNVDSIEAKEIITKHKTISTLKSKTLIENYNKCLCVGISKYVLYEHPSILEQKDILEKVVELRKLLYDINVSAPLLLLDINKLQQLVLHEDNEERISTLSKLFDVNASEVCKWIGYKPFLATLNLNHIKICIKLLADYGVTKEDIIKDMWVLKYSTSQINSRLCLAKAHNVEVIKTWMVRTQPITFERHIQRQSDNKSILGNNSIVQYLCERLECNEEVIRYIITKHSALLNKSLKKLNEMLDFLHLKGFSNIQICRSPKILLHRVETVDKRLEELKSHGIQLDTLHMLTKSRKQFMQFIDSFNSSKKKNVKKKKIQNK